MCKSLSLSIKRSNVILVGSRQKLRNHDLCITIDGRQLFCVSSIRYLGLYSDENLSWHKHIEYILQRVLSRVHCLFHLRPLSDNLLGRLYCTFVLPLIDYCDTVWTPSSMLHFKRLERLHSRFCTNNAELFCGFP